MTVGLGIAAAHAAFMGFLWLQIDAAAPVLDGNRLSSQIEREKERAAHGVGVFGTAKGRWQQRDEESRLTAEVSMAEALAAAEREGGEDAPAKRRRRRKHKAAGPREGSEAEAEARR